MPEAKRRSSSVIPSHLSPQEIIAYIRQTGLSPIYIDDLVVRDWVQNGSKYSFLNWMGYSAWTSWMNAKDE